MAQHRHVRADCGRRHLLADEARADDDQAGAGVKRLQLASVARVAQREHVGTAVQQLEAASLGAGGDEQPVVGQLVAVVQHQAVIDRLQAHGVAAQAQLDIALAVPVIRPEGELRRLGIPRQDALGERRAVVGAQRLGADHRDGAGVVVAAQRLDGPLGGEAAAGDDDVAAVAILIHRDTRAGVAVAVLLRGR